MNLNDLNREQRLAAETLEGPLLVLAGAGSGKTRALTYRVANLLEHGVPPWAIMAITFTNKAAKEMRERIEKLAGAGAEDIWVSTFHSGCAKILRRDIEKLGYTRSFTIYDDDDQMSALKEILNAYAGNEIMNFNQIMAAALVCVIPVVVLFFFCQKYILTGFSKAAMK